jgi:hypothetical protein
MYIKAVMASKTQLKISQINKTQLCLPFNMALRPPYILPHAHDNMVLLRHFTRTFSRYAPLGYLSVAPIANIYSIGWFPSPQSCLVGLLP